jgi:hypothetical protein
LHDDTNQIAKLHHHFLQVHRKIPTYMKKRQIGKYKDNVGTPILGTCQGRGKNPFLWAFLGKYLEIQQSEPGIGWQTQG